MSGPCGGRWARGVAFLLLLALSRPLAAQEETQAGEETEGGFEPVPYTDEEFADWLHDLRRFEIITFGSLPFTFLVSFMVYDLARYAGSGYEPAYRPFSNPNPIPYTDEEKIGVVLAACSVSVLIALADFIIGRIREAEAREELDGDF